MAALYTTVPCGHTYLRRTENYKCSKNKKEDYKRAICVNLNPLE